MVDTVWKLAGVMSRSGIIRSNSASTERIRLAMSSDVRPTSRRSSCEQKVRSIECSLSNARTTAAILVSDPSLGSVLVRASTSADEFGSGCGQRLIFLNRTGHFALTLIVSKRGLVNRISGIRNASHHRYVTGRRAIYNRSIAIGLIRMMDIA